MGRAQGARSACSARRQQRRAAARHGQPAPSEHTATVNSRCGRDRERQWAPSSGRTWSHTQRILKSDEPFDFGRTSCPSSSLSSLSSRVRLGRSVTRTPVPRSIQSFAFNARRRDAASFWHGHVGRRKTRAASQRSCRPLSRLGAGASRNATSRHSNPPAARAGQSIAPARTRSFVEWQVRVVRVPSAKSVAFSRTNLQQRDFLQASTRYLATSSNQHQPAATCCQDRCKKTELCTVNSTGFLGPLTEDCLSFLVIDACALITFQECRRYDCQ